LKTRNGSLLGCLFAAGFVLFAQPLALAEDFTAKVIVVLDGDTVLVLRGAQKLRIRLANIDAPEKAQEGGMASRQSLIDMVLHRWVRVSSQAVDKYGRIVGTLTLEGESVNEEQVRRGMAWEYSNYHRNKTYIALQSEAQQARRGLWAQSDPMPPWHWRKLHAAAAPALSATPQPASGQ
jgi:micrococcal nuclease